MFCVNGFQEFAETNAFAPEVKLQIIRVVLDVIACLRWNFRAMDVSMRFLRFGPLKVATYEKLPLVAEKGNISRKLLGPLYGMSTACKDWRVAIRDFLGGECVWVASVDKSVFLRSQQGIDYVYGGISRPQPNKP